MEHYKFFTNRDCEFHPCHKTDRINCLFCYCPLYFLDCGGNFKLTEHGIKDCSECLIPHGENGYDYIVRRLMEEADKVKQAHETDQLDQDSSAGSPED